MGHDCIGLARGLGCAALLLSACAVDGGTGRVSAPLSTTTVAGTQFRLHSATFAISGTSALTLSSADVPDDARTLSSDLPVGAYQIELADGWSLARVSMDGSLEPVDALLVSDNPQSFVIEDGIVTSLRYLFRTRSGEVTLGSGGVEIGFDVDADDDGDGSVAGIDCNDTDPSVHPGAVEITGDEIDEDCDGTELCFVDSDADSFRSTMTVPSSDVLCRAFGEATVGMRIDCDDTRANIHPGAAEIVGDEIDESCDGAELCFTDQDLDGFRGNDIIASSDSDCADPGEAGLAGAGGDCDDLDSRAHPGQAAFFTTPTSRGIFDFDCDGVAMPQFSSLLTSCPVCGASGWLSSIPPCGASAQWAVCAMGPSPLICVATPTMPQTQACR